MTSSIEVAKQPLGCFMGNTGRTRMKARDFSAHMQNKEKQAQCSGLLADF